MSNKPFHTQPSFTSELEVETDCECSATRPPSRFCWDSTLHHATWEEHTSRDEATYVWKSTPQEMKLHMYATHAWFKSDIRLCRADRSP